MARKTMKKKRPPVFDSGEIIDNFNRENSLKEIKRTLEAEKILEKGKCGRVIYKWRKP